MLRCVLALVVIGILAPWGALPSALAQSEKAISLRREGGLVPYAPPQAFLDGYFLTDPMHPAFLYGPVKDFVASRTCPATWLIEEDAKQNLDKSAASAPLAEYSLTLEVDCPRGVTQFVFVDQSALSPKDWFAWRRKFHGRKAEAEYGDTVAQLEKALADGYRVTGELRFVARDGVLDPRSPQDLPPEMLASAPRYDCQRGAPTGP